MNPPAHTFLVLAVIVLFAIRRTTCSSYVSNIMILYAQMRLAHGSHIHSSAKQTRPLAKRYGLFPAASVDF
ncbi:MAG: hypothetical protein ACJAW0_000200 [Zhongshania sp.]|jgi:hypothetical protein